VTAALQADCYNGRRMRTAAPELMDDPACAERELRAALRDLGRINGRFGAHAFVSRYLDRALPIWRAGRRDPAAPLRVLDVATGGADIPIAVAGWAARRGIPARVVAVDRHATTARLACEALAGHPDIRVVRADARRLPFADRSFDVALCTLTLHHLSAEDGVRTLQNLDRVSRVGFFVMDLVRSPVGYAAVWLLTRLSRSRVIRHDGPLSVLRAGTTGEYRRLADAARVAGLRVVPLPLFRVALERTR